MFEKKLREDLLDAIMLEHDEILIKFLVNFLKKEDTFIHFMLFNREFRRFVLDNFRGNYSGWDEDKNYGTHFFWHISQDGVQERMYFNSSGELETKKGFKMKFTLEEITKNMLNKQILPSMFVKFSTTICYLGIIPMGGYGSVGYLSKVKNFWVEHMPSKFAKEREWIKNIKTEGMITMPVTFKYNKHEDKVEFAYAFDLIYQGGLTKEYLSIIDKMKMHEIIRPGLPLCYNYYISMYGDGTERKNLNFDPKILYSPMKRLFKN